MNILKNYITFVNENLTKLEPLPSEDELLDMLKKNFHNYTRPNSTFPVEVKGKDGKVTKVLKFHIDADGDLNIENDVNESNKFTKSLAALCLIGGTLTSCSDKIDIKPNDTKSRTEVVDDNVQQQETPIEGKYAFTGGCNNWNSMYLKIAEDSILVLQKVPESWSTLPQYRIIDGVGFLVHYDSKLNNLTRTGKNSFEFNMDIKPNGVPDVAPTKFEINDSINSGFINTFGKATSGEIKRIYKF